MSLLMTPIRQKEIADAIKKSGFKLSDFDCTIISDMKFEVSYKQQPQYRYVTAPNPSYIYISPSAQGNLASTTLWASSFQGNIALLDNWLANLKANLAIGDPWAEIETADNEKIKIGDGSQEPLNENERNFIDEKLDIILEALKEFATDFERIKSDLEYLKYAGGNVSKKDWGIMVMGNVMGWAMSNAIHKDALHDVWNIIVQNLGSQSLIA